MRGHKIPMDAVEGLEHMMVDDQAAARYRYRYRAVQLSARAVRA